MSTPLTFLLGNHRSGTTWLYQLLADTEYFSVLRAGQVIEWEPHLAAVERHGPPPDPAGLAARMSTFGARLGEGVELSPTLPEEYGYLLNNYGRRSWVTPPDVPLVQAIVRVVADNRPVLLKNPWDYGHFPFLAAAFPEARFVFIHRHPTPVIHSAVSMFRAMWTRREPYLELLSRRYTRLWDSPVRRAVFQFLASGRLPLDVYAIAAGVIAANRNYAARIGTIAPERRLELRYEDLCEAPEVQRARILAFSGLSPGRAPLPTVSPRPRGVALLPTVAARGPAICRAMPGYLARMGYEADGGVIPWTPS